MRYAVATLLALALIGAVIWFGNDLHYLGSPPDPNDPRQAGLLTPEVLRNCLKGASDNLLERVQRGEITDDQYKAEMTKAANILLSEVDIDRIPSAKAWEYGEVYITARRWEDARKALKIAVKVAKNEDRRVNDNLRLARVMAELDDVPDAVAIARTTFNAPDEATAPILPATLLEIVPAGEGKGHDAELASLLEDAIACERRTIVDPRSTPGRDFLLARPIHIRNAWQKAIALYEHAGKPNEAGDARRKEADAASHFQTALL